LKGPIQRVSNRLGIDRIVLDQKEHFFEAQSQCPFAHKALGHSIQTGLGRTGRCGSELSESIVRRNVISITQGRGIIDRNVSTSLSAMDFRLPSNQLVMTQELIADMLGVRRAGATDAAGKLQKLGVIQYRRGHITVLDRPKLEHLSCECYRVV